MMRSLLLSFAVLTGVAQAQSLDVDEMISSINERSGKYSKLTQILQGSDSTRALAAFDVMLESGDKTMRETAISTAMSATDERLRARALWETFSQKDSFTITVDTKDLDADGKGALVKWIGAVSTWAITARFPETQCLNLYRTKTCEPLYHVSISGLNVDVHYTNTMQGSFVLNSEGVLVGEVTNVSTKAVYPASVRLR